MELAGLLTIKFCLKVAFVINTSLEYSDLLRVILSRYVALETIAAILCC